MFEFFPKSFSTKNVFVLPESYILFDINKKPIYQLHINPDLSGSWMIPFHKEESTDSFGFWPSKIKLPLLNMPLIPLLLLDLLEGLPTLNCSPKSQEYA